MPNTRAELEQRCAAVFEEIRQHVAAELGIGGGELDAEVEELTENWTDAECEDNRPQVTTRLQKLLREHYELGEKILDLLEYGES